MSLAERLATVRAAIAAACARADRDPAGVALLLVSKRFPTDVIRAAMAEGLTTFGENRVQELSAKGEELAEAGVAWHLIGSLQTNKVNQLLRVPGLARLHSMDRTKLANALQTALAEQDRTLEVLLQIHATGDENKHGVLPEDAAALLAHLQAECPNLTPVGLMAMGPLEGDPAPVFDRVARLRVDLQDGAGVPLPELSMGMSGDLDAAVAAGSTMVRVGTGVFGPRPPLR